MIEQASFYEQVGQSKLLTMHEIAVWSIFAFNIKRTLGIKRIFPCSFGNKLMRLLTCVYSQELVNRHGEELMSAANGAHKLLVRYYNSSVALS